MTPAGRRRLQRGVVVLPSAFTLGNLFLGFWAIISAARGEFVTAGWLIVTAAVLDMLDGRIARFTSTGSDFGEQLDSLVDAISFGVAPSLIIYFLFLGEGAWSWTISYLYVAAVIIRLARFNVEQAGGAKVAFHGLPSPTAGITLASFYPFTQTAFFERYLSDLEWTQLTTGLVLALSVLMVSHVLYPVIPRFSFRNRRGIVAIVIASISLVAAFTIPALFFFPAALIYIATGLVRVAVMGFLDRLPERDPLLDVNAEEDEQRELDYEEIQARPRIRDSRKQSDKRI